MRIDGSIIAISPFRVNVIASDKSVGLSTQTPGVKRDNKMKMRKILRPPGLPAGQELRSRKILQVFVVSNHVNWSTGTLEIMAPDLEHLEDSEKFLVMGVIVQLGRGEGPRMKHDRVQLRVVREDGQNRSDSIVGGIGFNDNLLVRKTAC